MTLRNSLRFCVLAVLFNLTGHEAAAAAPTQLYDKTIVLTWTSNIVQKSADGRVHDGSIDVSRWIYVSTAGRLFARATRSRAGRQVSEETSPGASSTSAGRATQVRFEGNRLVGTVGFSNGAHQLRVDFTPGFQSCTLNVAHGKQAGAPIRAVGLDGQMKEFISVRVSSQSCSIRDGNALAN